MSAVRYEPLFKKSRGRATALNGAIEKSSRDQRNQKVSLEPALLFLFLLSVPLDVLPLLAGGSLTSPLAALLICNWVVARYRDREAVAIPAFLGGLLYAYFTIVLLASFHSVSQPRVLAGLLTLAVKLLAFLIVLDIMPKYRRWAPMPVALGSSVFAASLLMLGERDAWSTRTTLLDVDPNISAFALTVGATCSLIMYYSREPLGSVVGAASLILSSIGILATGSRTGLIALLFLLITFILITSLRMRDKVRVRRNLYLGAALVASPVYLAVIETPERILEFISDPTGVGTSGRDVINGLFWQNFSDWALWGVGYQSAADYLLDVGSLYFYPHNLFLRIWVELGIIGFILIILLFAYAAWGALHRQAHPLAITGLVAPVIFSLTLGGMETVAPFWLAFAVSVDLSTEQSDYEYVPLDVIATSSSRRTPPGKEVR